MTPAAVLQQCENDDEGKPIYFAFRLLTEMESKFSTKELELMAVVWSTEHFRDYVNGISIKFYVILDHRALGSVLKKNC